MRGLLNRLQVGVFRASAEGRVLEANPAFLRLLGLGSRELRRGLDLASLFAEPQDHERLLRHLPDGGRQVQEEVRLRRPDGSELWVALTIARPESDGGPPGLEGMIEDVSRRRAAEAALRESHAKLRALAGHLQTVREEERARIAAQVHDELGQPLSALKMGLAWLRRHLDPAQGEPRSKLGEMCDLLDSTIATVRGIYSEMGPHLLGELGLPAAVEWQTRQLAERAGIEASLEVDASVDPGKEVATSVFRVLQELLGNALHHAGASRVWVRLAREGETLVLAVADDGRGIRPEEAAKPETMGLLEVHERAHRLGGTVEIGGTAGQGTRAVVRVPLAGRHPPPEPP